MYTPHSLSNYQLTAQPRILFYAFKSPVPDAALWERVFGTEGHQEIREFTPKMLAQISGDDQNILHALHLLRETLSVPSTASTTPNLYKAVLPAVRLLIPKLMGSLARRIERKNVLQLYVRLVRQYLRRARLTLTVKNGEPSIAVVCADLFTAAVVFSVYEAMAICPSCQKVFAPSAEHNQKFCSKNCGQRVYQKHYRERQKIKKKGARRR